MSTSTNDQTDDDREPRMTVHRSSCGDDDTCDSFTTIDTDPEGGYVIGTLVTDPAIIAAHGRKLGPGEVVIRLDRALAPEVWR